MKFEVRTYEQVEVDGLFDNFDRARDRVRDVQHSLREEGYQFEGEINKLVVYNPKTNKRFLITINGVNPYRHTVGRAARA